MLSQNYEQATIAYNSGDYPSALRGFYRALKEDYAGFAPGDAGLVYHRLGNCLLKMRNLNEALATYRKALEDEQYGDRGGVLVNLGTTLNGMRRYQEAISHFEQALADYQYKTPYKADMGLGNAYARLGMFTEAGTAYRKAALDESNPNPIKALMNLGSSFSSLGRPQDAIEAYLAIIDFKASGQVLNKTYEQLGCSYVAVGRCNEAVCAFEDALRDGTHQLSAQAQDDFDRARAFLGLSVPKPSTPDYSGLDTEVTGGVDEGEYGYEEDYGAGGVPLAENTGFFTASDADLMRLSKRQMRKERKLRHTGLKVFLAIVILLILLLGGAVLAYTQGYGFPTQESVVTDFFGTNAQGKDVSSYWVSGGAADEQTIKRILEGVPASSDVTIEGVERSMGASTVVASLRLSTGGTVHYRISLVRDFLSWRINGIDQVFASTT